MENRRESVDWTGRILSIVSLVVAMGVGGYVVTQGQVANTRDELLNSFDQELQRMITAHEEKRNALDKQFSDALDRNDQRMNDWNQQLVSAIDSFDQDAKQLLGQIEDAETHASEDRLANFQKEMIELRRLAVTEPGNDATLDKGDDSQENESAATQNPSTQLAVHTALKVVPGDAKEPALIRIENSGDQDALIERVQFKPESDFRVESQDEAKQYAHTDTILVFAYDTSDNTSTKPGQHGLYDRKLAEPIRIPAGESLTLRVVITDREYLGWGFAGQLRLDYNSKEPLVVQAARVYFEDLDARDDLIKQST